jgi:pimeloyl-ACP methyl ester carboxylesterase
MNDQPATQLFHFRRQQLAYQRLGTGTHVALAFHGFGQTSEVYAPLATVLGDVYTIYTIDLFLHGDSKRADSTHLAKEDWCDCIGAFLAEQQIDRFTVMGYSLGGRFALVLAECFASRLDALVLMAPDGIRFSRWYSLATQSTVGRSLFGFAMRHLPLLHQVGRGLVGLGLLRPSLLRFAEVSLSTPEQRQLVYDAWTQFRRIRPDLSRIADELTRHKVPTQLIVGSYDQIVPANYLLSLTRLLTQYTLTQLPTGHNRLIDKSAAVLRAQP